MDKVYSLSNYRNSGILHKSQFLCSSSNNFILAKKPYKHETWVEDIKNLMDMGDLDVEKVASECSTELLQGEENKYEPQWSYQKYKFIPTEVTPESLKLNTVQKYVENKKLGISQHTWLKYRSEKRIVQQEVPPNIPIDLVPGENLVIKIRMYHPFKYLPGERGEVSFYHNLVVLGSQTLDQFKNKIICPSELSTCTDHSEHPDRQEPTPKEMFQSGFFFIDNTFYNDMRNPANIDYSENIIQWAKTRPEIGEFSTASMADTTFHDLNIKLGLPHVYRHMGECEHIFVFSDIELLQSSDPCSSLTYPMYTSCSLNKAQYCHMCGVFVAKWRVTESDRIPFDPAFFCEICFHSYNYIDGVKVGNFKAFAYFDSVNAM